MARGDFLIVSMPGVGNFYYWCGLDIVDFVPQGKRRPAWQEEARSREWALKKVSKFLFNNAKDLTPNA